MAALDRIDQSPPLLRPVAAVWDLVIAPDEGKRAVAGQAIQSFVPAVQLSAAASAWALIGGHPGLVRWRRSCSYPRIAGLRRV